MIKCVRCGKSGINNYEMGSLTMGEPYPVWICSRCHRDWDNYHEKHDIGSHMINKFNPSIWKEFFEKFIGKNFKPWRIA